MIVRPAHDQDLKALWAIALELGFSPWTEAQLAAELHVPGGLSLVLEQKEVLPRKVQHIPPKTEEKKICGYAFFRLCPPEAEILQVVIAPCCRQQGMASLLLQKGLRQVAQHGCTACFLEVRRSNQAAQRLYQCSGFQQSGRRKNYYCDPVEDALLFYSDLKQ